MVRRRRPALLGMLLSRADMERVPKSLWIETERLVL
jgi:hypothetical protein